MLILKQISISLAVLLIFFTIFSALQNPEIYYSTFGKISSNYEKGQTPADKKVKPVKKPYVETTDGNLLNWDAELYADIRDDFYFSDGPILNLKFAFFP